MRPCSVPCTSPAEDSLHAGDAHPVHDVPGQPEGDSLWGGQDLALLEGHAYSHRGEDGDGFILEEV